MAPHEYVLQAHVSPDDVRWIYPQAPNSPPRTKSDKSQSTEVVSINSEFYLRHITFTSRHTITFSCGIQKTNRILSSEVSPFENIIVVSFEQLRFPEDRKAAPDYIKRFLSTGVVLNGRTFKFYGHSNSQLRSRTCYMYSEINVEKLWNKINAFGDFRGIMSVAKRAKRIGLLFSAAEMGIKLNSKQTQDIPDIESNGQVYTDGCGFISQRYAQELAKRSKIIYRDERYTPSVFQIRYKGYKGTLYINPVLDKNKEFKSIKIQFRDSMRKFKNCPDDTFSILEYSKPYEFGKLNGEIVSLLSSLGIPDEVFLRKLTFHLKFIQDASENDQSAFLYLSYHNQHKLAEKVLLDGLSREIRKKIRSLQSEDYGRFFKNKREEKEPKVHIMVPDSRLLFGICDSTEKLEENEIFLRITKEGFGRVTLTGAEVIVTRNPCLHPGDIQKFKCVRIEELEHLVDCIVFSTKGERPAPSLMSGGDLDGDKFFVCWDKELIPSCLSEPYGYPPAKESIRREIKHEDMITYFANYNNASLGKCKNLYLQWMKCKPEGARSRECQELNALFSNCVDGQPIKIPEHLQTPPENPPKKFILDLICDRVKTEVVKKTQEEQNPELLLSMPMSIIEVIAASDEICLDEFELLQLVHRWTISKNEPLIDYLPHFDFSSLTSIQKHWIESQIPAEDRRRWHGLIFNGLFQSDIVTEIDLKSHHLDSEYVNWQRLYSSSLASINNNNNNDSELGTVVAKDMMQKSLQLFQKKLIIIKVNSRFAYGIYLNKTMNNDTINLFQCCKLFAFTCTTGGNDSSRFITVQDYILSYDGEVFQLYQSLKRNSFIFLRFGETVDDKKKRQIGRYQTGPGRTNTFDHNRNRNCQVTKNVYTIPSKENPTQERREVSENGIKMITSVALDKFSRRVQTSVGRVFREETQGMEIYVISNRDRVGHQILDISINQVNTSQIYKIIQNMPNEYAIPSMESIASELDSSSLITQILKNLRKESVPDSIFTIQPNQFFELCQVCTKYGLKTHLETIVKFILSPSSKQRYDGAVYSDLYRIVVELLAQAPYLSVLLSESLNFPTTTTRIRLALCSASIKCANEYQRMALELFKKSLESLLVHHQNFDAGTTVEIIKQIIFTIRNCELAQDFILELFGEENKCIIDVGGSDVHGYAANEYFKRHTLPVAMNYISEIQEKCSCDWLGRFITINSSKAVMKCLEIKESPPSKKSEGDKDKATLFETTLRVDCLHMIRNGDHLRLRASSPPTNQPDRPLTIIDIIVDSIYNGCLKFRIQQQTPVELLTASWDLYECGSPTTLITMMEALQKMVVDKQATAWSYKHIVDNSRVTEESSSSSETYWPMIDNEKLDRFLTSCSMNSSQVSAVKCATNNVTTLIWGPPGTGKTTVVVQIILAHLHFFPNKKILVTASTHNATDNILERVIAKWEVQQQETQSKSAESEFIHMGMEQILRVTSDVGKVNKKLQKWTLDAFVGANLHENHKKRKEAMQRLKQAKVVFSTCSGAGVGLLRSEDLQFEVVIVDEASQLTEPNALVPLVKGSQRIVLVGDHVQLRPTVSELGKAYEGDTSLFERLYKDGNSFNQNVDTDLNLGKTMLDVQYRMHPLLVQFPSQRFYDGCLKSGVTEDQRRLPNSEFPWPREDTEENGLKSFIHPVVFIQCDHPESKGTSKKNIGQINIVKDIIKKLRTTTGTVSETTQKIMKITVLTPYTLQLKELRQILGTADVEVATIDGFQGRENDIIIFSTVRSNKSGAVGFLEDYRRMNVALTRAKFGLIVVGDESTLKTDNMWNAWLRLCKKVTLHA